MQVPYIKGKPVSSLIPMAIPKTSAKSVVEGDEVVIFDDIEGLEAMAEALNTIPYEIMTGISERIHRVYLSE